MGSPTIGQTKEDIFWDIKEDLKGYLNGKPDNLKSLTLKGVSSPSPETKKNKDLG